MKHQYVNEFHDSMNEHCNATYRVVTGMGRDTGQGFVIELERHRRRDGDDRGRLIAWQRPESDPREADWRKAGSQYTGYDHAKDLYRSFETKQDVRQWAERT